MIIIGEGINELNIEFYINYTSFGLHNVNIFSLLVNRTLYLKG